MAERREHHDGCRERGLYVKYEVQRTDGTDQPGGRHDGCRTFVLDLDHDPEAQRVLLEYARLIRDERRSLSDDLARLVGMIRAGESGRWSSVTIAKAQAEVEPVEPAGRTAASAVLRQFAHSAGDWLKPRIPDGLVAPYSLIQVRLALLTGADALEQADQLQNKVEQMRIALTAARWWMVEHGLPLTNGHAILVRGVSWVDVDTTLDLGTHREVGDG
jgi:hypothetical protein